MNERMTWDQLVSLYPDRWVVLKDTEKEGPDIISGILIAVKTDEEIIEFENSHLREGYEFWRTTEGDFYGIVDLDINIAVN